MLDIGEIEWQQLLQAARRRSTLSTGQQRKEILVRDVWEAARFREKIFLNLEPDACRGSKQQSAARAGQNVSMVYLRDAQAYMLISMPTDTSTIFGVFQVIRGPPN